MTWELNKSQNFVRAWGDREGSLQEEEEEVVVVEEEDDEGL
jgi:hypothetical protein